MLRKRQNIDPKKRLKNGTEKIMESIDFWTKKPSKILPNSCKKPRKSMKKWMPKTNDILRPFFVDFGRVWGFRVLGVGPLLATFIKSS